MIFILRKNSNYSWETLLNLKDKKIITNNNLSDRITFIFYSQLDSTRIKYFCRDSFGNIYRFSDPNKLCDYMLTVIDKNLKSCFLCKKNYIKHNKKLLKELNGFCKENLSVESCDKYCSYCKNWLESESKEISNLENKIKKKLIPDIWKIIDLYLKSINFKCKHCTHIFSSKGILSNDCNKDDIPYGECSMCYF